MEKFWTYNSESYADLIKLQCLPGIAKYRTYIYGMLEEPQILVQTHNIRLPQVSKVLSLNAPRHTLNPFLLIPTLLESG